MSATSDIQMSNYSIQICPWTNGNVAQKAWQDKIIRHYSSALKAYCISYFIIQLVDEDDEMLMALLNLEGSKPGKICASFEDLERQRREEEQKKAEEEARKRLEEEKKLFAEARKNMVMVHHTVTKYDNLHVFWRH